jgi:two-component system sensor histidine kinase/response regulator
MTYLQQQLSQFQERMKSVNAISWSQVFPKNYAENAAQNIMDYRRRAVVLHRSIKHIGLSASLEDYEQRKLGIFNQLNFFQLITGIAIPFAGLYHNKTFPAAAWMLACLPAVISIAVLWMNSKRLHEMATVLYFVFYPIATSIVYMNGIHMGTELFFILYGILSVFFIPQISHMLFSVSFNMISYFMLAVLWSDHRFQFGSANMLLYLFNQVTSIVFIFYGLFLIKKENIGYHESILAKNRQIAENAVLLRQQTVELTELNNLKNKLFSVIAHDLKTPMYSLRGLFRTIQLQNIPPKEIKAMLPDMINNLNYTTGLMENLLQWAKSQMQSGTITFRTLDPNTMIGEVAQLMQLTAAAKQISIETRLQPAVSATADKNMIDLVLRNLLSNAVKFTPASGTVTIGARETPAGIEIFVADTGRGISEEAMQKINRNDYYTTNGTAHEPGTGLGLMLCKEFLLKNKSQLSIDSEPGKGSRFSFVLPQAQA